MAVPGAWIDPSYPAQAGAGYPNNLDIAIAIGKRFADWFGPHAQASANMTISADAGGVLADYVLTERAQQNTGTIVAAGAGNQRYDRLVAHESTGTLLVVTGVQSGSPIAPPIPTYYTPVALIGPIDESTTSVDDTMITDERAIPQVPAAASGRRLVVMEDFDYPVAFWDGTNTTSGWPKFNWVTIGNSVWNPTDHSLSVAGNAAILSTRVPNGAAASYVTPHNSGRNTSLRCRFMQHGTSAATRNFGLFSTESITAVSEVGFRFTNLGNITAVCRAASTESTLDTGVAVSNSAYKEAEIRVNSTGNTADVFVDSVYKGRITTNVPVAAALGRFIHAGAAASTGVRLDFFRVEEDRPA